MRASPPLGTAAVSVDCLPVALVIGGYVTPARRCVAGSMGSVVGLDLFHGQMRCCVAMSGQTRAGRAGLRSALWLPLFDDLADPVMAARLAGEAEEAGWHGVFVWDHVHWGAPVRQVAGAWITLAAIAAATERVRLGPMVTALARRRPVHHPGPHYTVDGIQFLPGPVQRPGVPVWAAACSWRTGGRRRPGRPDPRPGRGRSRPARPRQGARYRVPRRPRPRRRPGCDCRTAQRSSWMRTRLPAGSRKAQSRTP